MIYLISSDFAPQSQLPLVSPRGAFDFSMMMVMMMMMSE